MKKIITIIITLSISLLTSMSVFAGTWHQDGNGWWYDRGDNSYPQNEWLNDKGVWYYFDSNGYIKTGWQKINGAQYYFWLSGGMATGWAEIAGDWYYFDGSGAMVRGWQQINDWYYFGTDGRMVYDDWVGEYYLTESGAMGRNIMVDDVWLGSDGRKSNNYSMSGSKKSESYSRAGSGTKNLYSLTNFDGNVKWVTKAKDCLGNEFGTSLSLRAHAITSKNPTMYQYSVTPLEYYLNSEYNNIKGILAFDSENTKNKDSLMMQIYADDELVYESDEINEKTDPIGFDVDIESAEFIKIMVTEIDGGASNNKLIISNVVLYNE